MVHIPETDIVNFFYFSCTPVYIKNLRGFLFAKGMFRDRIVLWPFLQINSCRIHNSFGTHTTSYLFRLSQRVVLPPDFTLATFTNRWLSYTYNLLVFLPVTEECFATRLNLGNLRESTTFIHIQLIYLLICRRGLFRHQTVPWPPLRFDSFIHIQLVNLFLCRRGFFRHQIVPWPPLRMDSCRLYLP